MATSFARQRLPHANGLCNRVMTGMIRLTAHMCHGELPVHSNEPQRGSNGNGMKRDAGERHCGEIDTTSFPVAERNTGPA
jgi:hypothetical protein